MSLPRQVASHSSSPSKSSLRKTGGTQNPTRTLLPSPHFEETLPHPPAVQQKTEDDEAFEEKSAQLDQLALQPFFTLIEDSVTNEHYHPTVHYIFSDDDADIITEAAFRSLEPESSAESYIASQGYEEEHEEDEGRLPPADPNVREHYLVLDVHPTDTDKGSRYSVTRAQSLSSEWQILRTNVTTAPTFNAEAPDAEDGLMLKIEGRGNTPPDTESEKSRAERDTESLEAMVENFQKRLDDIKRTMAAAGQSAGGFPLEDLAE